MWCFLHIYIYLGKFGAEIIDIEALLSSCCGVILQDLGFLWGI